VQLDAGRLRDLQVFTEDERRDIGRGAIRALVEQLGALERALAEGNLQLVAEVAHRARNETLVVGARELGQALQSVEDAARAVRASLAGEAVTTARALWPSTREAIARLSYGATG
jgi:HPt (histidine-containing phosphotransfer) domain-containing protein